MQTNDALALIYAGQNLSMIQSERLFTRLMQGELDNISITALLVALKMKGECIEEIAGAASAMTKNARPFPRPDYAFSDIVGTGGDGHNTINISSAAALVAAACGVKVAKHGNKSVSSKSGSSDLFASFGLNLMMDPKVARRCLDEANFCFLAAPNYHSGVAHVMPVRNHLKTRTLFNILGPLANPARPSHGIYGVYDKSLLDTYAQVLQSLGHQHALIVHGGGLDELCLHDHTEARLLTSQGIENIVLRPEDFAAQRFPIEALAGGEPSHNRSLIEAALQGKGEVPHIQAIALNAAALIWLQDTTKDKKACFQTAIAAMQDAKPLELIYKAAQISHEEQS